MDGNRRVSRGRIAGRTLSAALHSPNGNSLVQLLHRFQDFPHEYTDSGTSDKPGSSTPPAVRKPRLGKEAPRSTDRIILVSYPKIMFLYPTVLTAIFCGLVMWFKGGLPDSHAAAPAPAEQAAAAGTDAAAPAAGRTGRRRKGSGLSTNLPSCVCSNLSARVRD